MLCAEVVIRKEVASSLVVFGVDLWSNMNFFGEVKKKEGHVISIMLKM